MWSLNKPYENEVILREKNINFTCCHPLELLIYFGKRFRSLHTGNVLSVDQRAAKLLAVKVCASPCGPGSNPPKV